MATLGRGWPHRVHDKTVFWENIMNCAVDAGERFAPRGVRFGRMALVGCGLIGGSLARALHSADVVGEIAACGPDAQQLHWALAHGVISEIAPSVAQAVRGADLIVLAAPVGAMAGVFAEMASVARDAQALGEPCPALITDVGSTKANVLAAAAQHLPAPWLAHFVGAHPIAGREVSGVQHASADLFKGARAILTPSADTAAQALERARALWQAAGCELSMMAADEHDRVFAALSHLPHMLAFALTHATIVQNPHWAQMIGGGFRDTTRIAASSPVMWRDILLANAEHVLDYSQRMRQMLEAFEAAIAAQDTQALQALIEVASQARARC